MVGFFCVRGRKGERPMSKYGKRAAGLLLTGVLCAGLLAGCGGGAGGAPASPRRPRRRAAPPPAAGWRPSAWRGAPTGASQIPICTSPAAPARPRCAWCTAACWRRTRPATCPGWRSAGPWTATTTPSPSLQTPNSRTARPSPPPTWPSPWTTIRSTPRSPTPWGWGTAIWWTTIRWWTSRPSPSP